MTIFSRDLNLPVGFLHPNFEWKKVFTAHSVVNTEKTLHRDVLDLLKDHGISITSVELFYRRPNPKYGIVHVDNVGYDDRLNLNYIIGGEGSVMSWFKPLKEGYKTVGDTGATPIRYHFEDVELIHSAEIKQPSMIQSAIPHAILNQNKPRWCVCANMRDTKTRDVITMQDGIERLKEYLL